MNRREMIKTTGTALSTFLALSSWFPDVQAENPQELRDLQPDLSGPEDVELEMGNPVWTLTRSVETTRVTNYRGDVVAIHRSPIVKTVLAKIYRTNALDTQAFDSIGKIVLVDPPGFPKLARGRDWLNVGPVLSELGHKSRYRWEVQERFQLSEPGGWPDIFRP